MKKYTHVICLEDIIEDEISIIEKGKRCKITGFDYKSLVYYIEIDSDPSGMLTDEIVISPLDTRFKFITL